MKYRWVERPVLKKLSLLDVWEHPPLDYYRYGEYPRFHGPIRPPELPTEWVKIEDENYE